MSELSQSQIKLLHIIDRWGGDLPSDAEEQIGCRGAAFDAVIGALLYRKYLTEGAWGTFNLTEQGQAALRHSGR